MSATPDTQLKASDTAAIPSTQTQALVATHKVSLIGKFAAKYSIDPGKLMDIMKATAFKQRDGAVTNEQMAALLVVADQYGLNPFTKEIYAFPDKGGIVPVVGVDGWSRIINDHQQSDGFEFIESETMIDFAGKKVPEWMDVIIYRKDRNHPIKVRERFDEVKRDTQPWKSHPSRMLRHKTLIQGARIAFGFVGIYDEDEAERIIEGEIVTNDFQSTDTKALNDSLKSGQTKSLPAETKTPDQPAPSADFEVEQPGKPEPQFTVVDVKAKITKINDLVKKAKRPADWVKVSDLLNETVDMASGIDDLPEETVLELDALTDQVSRHMAE